MRPQSLCRDRATPTSIAALKNFAPGHAAYHQAIEDIIARGRKNFPQSIFEDYDYFASVLAETYIKSSVLGQKMAKTVLRLLHLFSSKTTIRFAYLHDFLYGFDWAKWLRKNPVYASPKVVGPFDQVFLDAVEKRGHELLALIEKDDEKYHRLRDDKPRNPFVFSRDAHAEQKLFRELAAQNLIPVRAWRTQLDETPRFARDYSAARNSIAHALGIGHR